MYTYIFLHEKLSTNTSVWFAWGIFDTEKQQLAGATNYTIDKCSALLHSELQPQGSQANWSMIPVSPVW